MHFVPYGTKLVADFADVDADVSGVGFLPPTLLLKNEQRLTIYRLEF
jgi:hypothetical protein